MSNRTDKKTAELNTIYCQYYFLDQILLSEFFGSQIILFDITDIAAQIFNGERSLLSNSSKVSDLITTMGDVHHIFPKEYLKQNGITDKSTYNQVANFAYLDTV